MHYRLKLVGRCFEMHTKHTRHEYYDKTNLNMLTFIKKY